VVADADRVTVTLYDRRIFTARVIGRDPSTDVALIKIDGTGLPTAVLGDDRQVQVGQPVVAIGNPLGLRSTVTSGIVSAKERSSLGELLNNRYAVSTSSRPTRPSTRATRAARSSTWPGASSASTRPSRAPPAPTPATASPCPWGSRARRWTSSSSTAACAAPSSA
jgi:hypothetical protein